MLSPSQLPPHTLLRVNRKNTATVASLSSDSDSNVKNNGFAAAPASSPRPLRSRKKYLIGAGVLLLALALGLGLGLGLRKKESEKGDEPDLSQIDWEGNPFGDGPLPTMKRVVDSPRGGSDWRWKESYEKAAKLVSKMSLAEKVNVTTGIGWSMGPCVGNTGSTSVGFPRLCLQDGPLGVRFADRITVFPAGITVAASFNRRLMELRGAALGYEAKKKGVNVMLGPSIGPLGAYQQGGRNWEGFGSDAYLQGVAARYYVRGMQGEGVTACAKHFLGNEQERFRRGSESAQYGFVGVNASISSAMTMKSIREVYGWPFEEVIDEGVGCVMCAYNMVNNTYSCENSGLLNGVLKRDMGFQGFVVSDWVAQMTGVDSALAGM